MHGISLYEAGKSVDLTGIPVRTAKKITEFCDMLKLFHQVQKKATITEMTEQILSITGYQKALNDANTLEAKGRLENLEEFLSVTKEFDEKLGSGRRRKRSVYGLFGRFGACFRSGRR